MIGYNKAPVRPGRRNLGRICYGEIPDSKREEEIVTELV